MMSRKGKKGFKRLATDTHEMMELNRNGQTKLDSGSEDEILDLTVEHEGRGSCCYSCCVWFSILYVGLLTILVLLLGAFSGYILASIWQIDQHNNGTRNSIREDIEKLRDEFHSHTKNTYYVLDGLKDTMFEINTSSSSLHVSLNKTLLKMTEKVEGIEERLKKLESHPQGVLIKQIDFIHQKMAILDRNMVTLNQSLDELHDMRSQMASTDSVLNSYDAKLKDLSSTIGDTIHDNTNIQDSVQGLADRIQNFSKDLISMDSRMNKSHDTIKQSLNQSSTRFSNLQSLVENMNETMTEEMTSMESILTNLTGVESVVSELRTDVDTLLTNLTTLSRAVDHIHEFKPAPPASPTASLPSNSTPVTTSQVVASTATPKAAAEATSKATVPPTRIADEMDMSTKAPYGTSGGHNDNSVTKSPPDNIQKDNSATGSPPETSVGHKDNSVTKIPPETSGENTSPPGGIVTPSDADDTDGTSVTPVQRDGSDEEEDGDEPTGSSLSAGILVLQRLYENFAKWDMNNDDVLTKPEFTRYINMPSIFNMLDDDNNGSVERAELQSALDMLKNKDEGSPVDPPAAEGGGGER